MQGLLDHQIIYNQTHIKFSPLVYGKSASQLYSYYNFELEAALDWVPRAYVTINNKKKFISLLKQYS